MSNKFRVLYLLIICALAFVTHSFGFSDELFLLSGIKSCIAIISFVMSCVCWYFKPLQKFIFIPLIIFVLTV